MLTLYRDALRLRREIPGLLPPGWPGGSSAADVLDFDRGAALRCVVNLSPSPVELPGRPVLLASSPLEDGQLPPDTTAWLRP